MTDEVVWQRYPSGCLCAFLKRAELFAYDDGRWEVRVLAGKASGIEGTLSLAKVRALLVYACLAKEAKE